MAVALILNVVFGGGTALAAARFMYWDVKTVRPLPNYRIYVEIEDGGKGVFDLTPYLYHGVFRELRDVHYFNRVGVVLGAVTWPNHQDIAPETLLAEMVFDESTSANAAAHKNHWKI